MMQRCGKNKKKKLKWEAATSQNLDGIDIVCCDIVCVWKKMLENVGLGGQHATHDATIITDFSFHVRGAFLIQY